MARANRRLSNANSTIHPRFVDWVDAMPMDSLVSWMIEMS